jgi:hypothetical protein
VIWQRLSEVEMRPVRFVDKPLLQADAFHAVVGRKGAGKGTVIANIAARVTRGKLGERRGVVWISSEDSPAIDIRPRVEAAGGDPDRILVVKHGWIQLPRDIDLITSAVISFDRANDRAFDVAMVVIDPVGNHISGRNSNSETDIRDAIAPLNAVADERGVMIFAIRHLSEKECSRGVLAAILGSSAWVQVPRAVLAVVRDDEDPQLAHVQCVAGNRLPPGTPGRMFRIEGVLLPGFEEEVTRAVWAGASTKDVEAMLASPSSREPSRSDEAIERMLDVLEDEGDQEAERFDSRIALEFGLSAGTVRNLRGKLGKNGSGLVKAVPVLDENGNPERWLVVRTAAERP